MHVDRNGLFRRPHLDTYFSIAILSLLALILGYHGLLQQQPWQRQGHFFLKSGKYSSYPSSFNLSTGTKRIDAEFIQ